MTYYISIARKTYSLTGYETIEIIETLPQHEAEKKLAGEHIIRRFHSPFNYSIIVVVID